MDYQMGHVLTLANSIIGVSILAMPYCFKQCGIVLSTLILLASNIISRLSCHFLLKSAILSRRKNFEYLAFYVFGALGKFFIEIGMIGFLLGTCIAFFVVMGDLGPEIISEMTGVDRTITMRTSVLLALTVFCVLPLGLLRNIDSLEGVSKATIGFYCCLVLKVMVEALPHIFSRDWVNNVNLWRPAGILQCLPIFTMALCCQTQLFEIYQAVPNASLEKMNNVIRAAVNICTWVYIFVGVFGYLAFFPKNFTGNIMLSFRQSLLSDVLKIGFILSLAFSFPLVIFPCRNSLYSLLFKKPSYTTHEGSSNFIPEGSFKILTFFIIFISLIIGIMIPNIELVLGLVGSTIGVLICVIFPAMCLICVVSKNTNERLLAQLMLVIGILVMVLGTYANLYAFERINMAITEPPHIKKGDDAIFDKFLINTVKPLQQEASKDPLANQEIMNRLNNKDGGEIENKDTNREIEQQAPAVEEVPLAAARDAENKIKDKQEPQILIKDDKDNIKEKQEPVVEPKEPMEENKETHKKKQDPKVVAEENKSSEIKEAQEPVVEPKAPVEENKEKQEPVVEPKAPVEDNINQIKEKQESIVEKIENDLNKQPPQYPNVIEKVKKADESRQQPVIEPQLPAAESKINKPRIKETKNKPEEGEEEKPKDINLDQGSKNKSEKKTDEVDIEAIKKEEKELKEQEKERKVEDILIDTIQKQHEVQKEIFEQNKKLFEVIQKQQEKDEINKVVNEEKLKAVKQIESIALKAIEQIQNQKEKEPINNLTNMKNIESKSNLSLPIPLMLNRKASADLLNDEKEKEVKDELNKEIKEAKEKIANVVKQVNQNEVVNSKEQIQNNEIKSENKQQDNNINKINDIAKDKDKNLPTKKKAKLSVETGKQATVLETLIKENSENEKKNLAPESRLNRDILEDKKRSKRETIKSVCKDKTTSTEKPIIRMLCELSEPNNVEIELDTNLGQLKKVSNLPEEET